MLDGWNEEAAETVVQLPPRCGLPVAWNDPWLGERGAAHFLDHCKINTLTHRRGR
jgi:hypothetical protein